MNAVVILLVGIAVLVLGYVFYGKWLAEQWGVDPNRTTPAHELEDGNDYVPAKAPVLMGIISPPSPVQARSTDRFRRRYSAGYRLCCGC